MRLNYLPRLRSIHENNTQFSEERIMKCPQCQWENPDGTNTCFSCGAALLEGALSKSGGIPEGPSDPASTTTANAPSSAAAKAAAETERAARELRRKRAYSGSAEITGFSPYITQPSLGKQRVGQAEREMGWGLGVLFIVVIGVAYWVVYLNLPEDDKPYAVASPVAFLIEHVLRKPQASKVNFETYIGFEVGSPMMYDAKAALGLREVEKTIAVAPPAAAKLQTADPEPAEEPMALPDPKKSEPKHVVVAAVETVPAPAPPAPVEVAALAPVETSPPPKVEQEDTGRAPVVDRSIDSEKPPQRTKSECSSDTDKQDCAQRHVVTFKRNWGPVLAERVYTSEEMARRARDLWQREGKILEPNGRINETYVVKPKAFTPIPGHPA
jgi:hypothetical protein